MGAVSNHYSDLRFSVFPSDPFTSVVSPFQLYKIWKGSGGIAGTSAQFSFEFTKTAG